MQIQVRYFASTREAAGREAEPLDVPEGTTVKALRTLLAERHAGLAPLLPGVRLAVGQAFAEDERALAAGDVVALIPPVSGG